MKLRALLVLVVGLLIAADLWPDSTAISTGPCFEDFRFRVRVNEAITATAATTANATIFHIMFILHLLHGNASGTARKRHPTTR